LTQDQANKALAAITALVDAKDVIEKMKVERATSDAVIASANRVIEDYKTLDAINTLQISKYKDMMALYDSVIKMYVDMVARLEATINKPKSGFQKVMAVIEKVLLLASGIALGRL